jgi:hypothetical protein
VSNKSNWLLGLYTHRARLSQVILCKLGYLFWHSRREEHGLTLFWQLCHNRLDIGHKTHIQHPIGLI